MQVDSFAKIAEPWAAVSKSMADVKAFYFESTGQVVAFAMGDSYMDSAKGAIVVVDGANIGPVQMTTHNIYLSPFGYNALSLQGVNKIIDRATSTVAVVIAISEDGVVTSSEQPFNYGYPICDLGGGKFLASNKMTLTVCQVNGDNTITVGASVDVDTSPDAQSCIGAVFIGGKVVVLYGKYSPSGGLCRVGTVSGLSLSFPSPAYAIVSGSRFFVDALCATGSDTFTALVDFDLPGGYTTYKPHLLSCTLSGDTVTVNDLRLVDDIFPDESMGIPYSMAMSNTGALAVQFYNYDSYPENVTVAIYENGPIGDATSPLLVIARETSGKRIISGCKSIVYDAANKRFVSIFPYDENTAVVPYISLYMATIDTVSAFWTNFSGQSEIL